MSWFKVDDSYPDHPKTLAISLEASGLWVRCGAWAAHYRTDGFIPYSVMIRYGGTDELAGELVDAGFWIEAKRSKPQANMLKQTGFSMHDFTQYNPSEIEAKELRRHRSEAGRKGGKRSAITRQKTSEASAQAFASSSNEAKAKQGLEAKSNPVPSRPVPTPLLSLNRESNTSDNSSLSSLNDLLEPEWKTALDAWQPKPEHHQLARELAQADPHGRMVDVLKLASIFRDDILETGNKRNVIDFDAAFRKKIRYKASDLLKAPAPGPEIPPAHATQSRTYEWGGITREWLKEHIADLLPDGMFDQNAESSFWAQVKTGTPKEQAAEDLVQDLLPRYDYVGSE